MMMTRRNWKSPLPFVLIAFGALLWIGGTSESTFAGSFHDDENIPRTIDREVTGMVEANPKETHDGQLWYDGHRARYFSLSLDEVAVHADRGIIRSAEGLEKTAKAAFPGGIVSHANESVAIVKLAEIETRSVDHIRKLIDPSNRAYGFSRVTAVYYSNTDRKKQTPYVSTGEIIVHFREPQNKKEASTWGIAHNVQYIRSLGLDNAFLFRCSPGDACMETSRLLYQETEVKYCYPNWLRPREKRSDSLEERFLPDDPLYPEQWNLDNSGQGGGQSGEDVDIFSAWQDVDGSGVTISIVDDGLETDHEDLSGNIVPAYQWDYVGNDSDPSPGIGDNHGTACAGIAAAVGGNGLGISGAAPAAGLVGLRLLGATTDTNEAAALTRSNDVIDIKSNSWGPSDLGTELDGPGPLTKAAMLEGVTNGRNGKGSIYIWAGGNGKANGDNSNYDGYANSVYSIAVAATTDSGTQAWYSEPGANLLVNAPSNGGASGITTTDLMGSYGYDSGNYTYTFGGTSAATPLVAGIVALMLDANPQVTWRDVQQILAATAQKNDAGDFDWIQNGAGYWVNHKYGFGRVDASAAVSAASDWSLVGPQVIASGSTAPNLPIPDNDPNGVSSTIDIEDDISIEYVEVTFASQHPRWGDLAITLISPRGTESTLAETHCGYSCNATGPQYSGGWTFGIARLLGESSAGVWTLVVQDGSPGNTGSIDTWSLKIYGAEKMPEADVSLDKRDSRNPVRKGDMLTYSIDVTNNGPLDASGTVVTDILPEGVDFVSASASQGNCIEANGTVLCDIGELANGAPPVAITISVIPRYAGILSNTASVSVNEPDANQQNNSGTVSTRVIWPQADLSVTMTGEERERVGDSFDYKITVANRGPDRATDITLTDILPKGLELMRASTRLGSCVEDDHTVRCGFPNLDSGEQHIVVLRVKPTEAGLYTNSAQISSLADDPYPENNNVAVQTEVLNSGRLENKMEGYSDLTASQTESSDPAHVGEVLTYTVTVVNAGTLKAESVRLTDELPNPRKAHLINVIPSQGACMYGGHTVRCELGDMMLGASASVAISVIPKKKGIITNRATVRSNTRDINPSDNRSKAWTQVE